MLRAYRCGNINANEQFLYLSLYLRESIIEEVLKWDETRFYSNCFRLYVIYELFFMSNYVEIKNSPNTVVFGLVFMVKISPIC